MRADIVVLFAIVAIALIVGALVRSRRIHHKRRHKSRAKIYIAAAGAADPMARSRTTRPSNS